mgnify:CR=1 FL=1
MAAERNRGAERVHDGILQVDRHVESLDGHLVPYGSRSGDGRRERDEAVCLDWEDSLILARIELHNGDRAALDDHTHPLERRQPLTRETEQERAQVGRHRLA